MCFIDIVSLSFVELLLHLLDPLTLYFDVLRLMCSTSFKFILIIMMCLMTLWLSQHTEVTLQVHSLFL